MSEFTGLIFSSQVKEKEQAQAAGRELEATRKELDQAKQWKGHFESTQAKMLELELVIKELKEELNAAIVEKDDTKEQAKNEKEELEEVWSSFNFSLLVTLILLSKVLYLFALYERLWLNLPGSFSQGDNDGVENVVE